MIHVIRHVMIHSFNFLITSHFRGCNDNATARRTLKISFINPLKIIRNEEIEIQSETVFHLHK